MRRMFEATPAIPDDSDNEREKPRSIVYANLDPELPWPKRNMTMYICPTNEYLIKKSKTTSLKSKFHDNQCVYVPPEQSPEDLIKRTNLKENIK
eukprot:UN03196